MPAKTKASELDSKKIEGFPLENAKLKLVNDRGHIRVVERMYYWSKEKQRGLERRTYIGYVIENKYYNNEEYKAQFKRDGSRRLIPQIEPAVFSGLSPLDVLLAAELPLYYAVARAVGLLEDLTIVWGEERARAVLSVAFHWLHTAFNAVYLYESWSPGKLLPYKGNISAKSMTELFKFLISIPGWRKIFFAARIARLPEDEVLSFDATQIATEAQEVTYAHLGKGKEGGIQNQVGLILLVGHRTKMPVLFRVLPGNISDITTVQDMLFRFDEVAGKKRVFAAVLDRGYCSLENLAKFLEHKSRVIIGTKNSFSWVREAMETTLSSLWTNACHIDEQECWGNTVPIDQIFPDGIKRRIWVHVYRSDAVSHVEHVSLYHKLRKFESQWKKITKKSKNAGAALSGDPLLKYYRTVFGKPPKPGVDDLIRDDDAIDFASRYFGCFCNVTSFECKASEALIEYSLRDSIEKSFKAGKSYVNMDTIRSHSDETTEGRFIVSFCCMTILNEIYRRMKLETTIKTPSGSMKTLKPLGEEMTFNEIKNYLDSIRVVSDGNGHLRWMEITQKQHEIAARLGFPDVYRETPDWAL